MGLKFVPVLLGDPREEYQDTVPEIVLVLLHMTDGDVK